MSGKQVVLATFDSEAMADSAVESLKAWDEADDDIKANAIGVLVLDDQGKVKTQKLGRRTTAKGAGIGLVLAAVTPPTLVAGILGGGVLGALHHKGLGLSADERDRLGDQLSGGRAAVGVLVANADASTIAAKLTELGGTSEVHDLSAEVVTDVDKVAPAVEAAESTETTDT